MLEAMSKVVKFYKEWTCKSEASESQRTLVEAFLAEERYVDHNHTVLTFTNNCLLKCSHIWDILWGNMMDDEVIDIVLHVMKERQREQETLILNSYHRWDFLASIFCSWIMLTDGSDDSRGHKLHTSLGHEKLGFPLSDFQFLFFVVHVSNHWFLLSLQVEQSRIVVYNSYRGHATYDTCTRNCEPILKAYLRYEGYTNAEEFQLIFDETCPQQPNSSMNCAMYFLMYGENTEEATHPFICCISSPISPLCRKPLSSSPRGILFRKASRMSSRGKHTTAGKHSVEGEGQSSRAPAERRTKFRDDRLPELNVPSNIKLHKVNGVFKKIIQPRYMDFRSVEDMFPGLTKLFEEQGWLRFMTSQRSYSPSVVLEFYNNLGMIEDEFYTTVRGISFKITFNLFSRALQIPNDGVDVLTLEMDPAVTYTIMTNEPFDELKRIARVNAKIFPPLNRMIHHMFTTIIFPKDGSRELVSETHRTLFYHILRKEQINLPELMVNFIGQCFRDPKWSIPYACPITSMIQFVGVSLTANEVITLKSRSAYDITTATRMGYKMINGRVHRTLKGQADEEQEDEDTEEATEQDDEDVGANEAHIDIPQEVHQDIPTASQVPMSGDLKEFIVEQFNQLQSTLTQKLDQLNNRMEAIEENHGHMQRQLDTMDCVMMWLHDDYQNLHNFYNPRDPQGDNFSINVSSFGAQGPRRATPPGDDNP
ncbi:hypothetical protein Taro_048651 [Colocasia esculenta]|uniref:Ubiquitin-like protease family profile domain-containing protein n=1 Tax=Colocasia esculenta TaxID=4460 RepID=A0A843X8P8_COLES|nr:hypothetical protein [Colocasia esculenta]